MELPRAPGGSGSGRLPCPWGRRGGTSGRESGPRGVCCLTDIRAYFCSFITLSPQSKSMLHLRAVSPQTQLFRETTHQKSSVPVPESTPVRDQGDSAEQAAPSPGHLCPHHAQCACHRAPAHTLGRHAQVHTDTRRGVLECSLCQRGTSAPVPPRPPRAPEPHTPHLGLEQLSRPTLRPACLLWVRPTPLEIFRQTGGRCCVPIS